MNTSISTRSVRRQFAALVCTTLYCACGAPGEDEAANEAPEANDIGVSQQSLSGSTSAEYPRFACGSSAARPICPNGEQATCINIGDSVADHYWACERCDGSQSIGLQGYNDFGEPTSRDHGEHQLCNTDVRPDRCGFCRGDLPGGYRVINVGGVLQRFPVFKTGCLYQECAQNPVVSVKLFNEKTLRITVAAALPGYPYELAIRGIPGSRDRTVSVRTDPDGKAIVDTAFPICVARVARASATIGVTLEEAGLARTHTEATAVAPACRGF